MVETYLFSQDLSSSLSVREGFTLRPLARDDYSKGYFDCLQSLTWTGDVSKERFEERFDWLRDKTPGWYYVLVIEHEGRIVATGVLIVERKFIWDLGAVGHLEEICVRKEYQGQGLGKVIVEALNGIAEGLGCLKTILNCSGKNEAFYEKCGYGKGGTEMQRKFEGARTDDGEEE